VGHQTHPILVGVVLLIGCLGTYGVAELGRASSGAIRGFSFTESRVSSLLGYRIQAREATYSSLVTGIELQDCQVEVSKRFEKKIIHTQHSERAIFYPKLGRLLLLPPADSGAAPVVVDLRKGEMKSSGQKRVRFL
jgi:hypothetical protein